MVIDRNCSGSVNAAATTRWARIVALGRSWLLEAKTTLCECGKMAVCRMTEAGG
jgi:hypothetical protein